MNAGSRRLPASQIFSPLDQPVRLAPQPDLHQVAEQPAVRDDAVLARQRAGHERRLHRAGHRRRNGRERTCRSGARQRAEPWRVRTEVGRREAHNQQHDHGTHDGRHQSVRACFKFQPAQHGSSTRTASAHDMSVPTMQLTRARTRSRLAAGSATGQGIPSRARLGEEAFGCSTQSMMHHGPRHIASRFRSTTVIRSTSHATCSIPPIRACARALGRRAREASPFCNVRRRGRNNRVP